MGGFVTLPPVAILTAAAQGAAAVLASPAASDTPGAIKLSPSSVAAVQKATVQHMYTTHNSKQLQGYVEIYAELLAKLVFGADLKKSAAEAATKCGFDVAALVQAATSKSGSNTPSDLASYEADLRVIGGHFSSACYIEDSLPSLLYLAYKYADSPEQALIANTNVGGENCHRGSALGAVMGAAHGMSRWPSRWVTGLHAGREIGGEASRFGELCKKKFEEASSVGQQQRLQ